MVVPNFPEYLEPIAARISSEYEFVDELSRGKTGCAYRIRSRRTDQFFCLKTISPEVTGSNRDKVRQTLENEFRILRPLRHHSLPAVFDQNFEIDLPYYICTYHSGVTFDAFRKSGKSLSLRQSIAVIWSLLDVLKYIHQEGRQHCDLHAKNVMLSTSIFGEGAMVIDFSSGHRESDSSPETINRGNVNFKDFDDQPRAGLRGPRNLTGYQHSDFRALGLLLSQMQDCFFANATPTAKDTYAEFCRALIDGRLTKWGAVEERFLTVIDPYRCWNENADLFLSRRGRPQFIPIPATRGVMVGEGPLAVINTPVFQRLRKLKQLSFCDWFFPGATHTRFEHSLGVFHRASAAIKSLIHDRTFRDMVTAADVRGFLLAAILHDVGHYPFAHVIEQYAASRLWDKPEGRAAASHLGHSLHLMEKDLELRAAVDTFWGEETRTAAQAVLRGKEPLLSELLDGPIDIDKIDYLERDAIHCGVAFGAGLDTDGLLRAMRCVRGGRQLGIDRSGVSAAEGLMVLQDQMLSSVYWHKTIRALTCMFHAALKHLVGTDAAKFCDLVAALKTCDSEAEAIDRALLRRAESLPAQERDATLALLRPLTATAFDQIYIPVSTHSPEDAAPKGSFTSVYDLIVIKKGFKEDQPDQPIHWPRVRRLRYAYVAALREASLAPASAQVIVDVPYGKASRKNVLVRNDDTGVESEITTVSHLKESIFTTPTAYLSPIRVYIAPEIGHGLLESEMKSIANRAEELFQDLKGWAEPAPRQTS